MRGRRGMRNVEGRIARLSVLVSVIAVSFLLIAMAMLASRLHAQDAGVGVRFSAVDVFIDSGSEPLAAYQLSFAAIRGGVKIVGIEGGEHPAFKEAPYYDPRAIQQERAILAAFSTAPEEQLPKGWKRVATVHVLIFGTNEPAYTVKLEVAAGYQGFAFDARASLQKRNTK